MFNDIIIYPTCRNERAKPMIVDPGLYGVHRTDVFWVKERRSMPSSFKLFVGTTLELISFLPPISHLLLYDINLLFFFFQFAVLCVVDEDNSQMSHTSDPAI